MTDQPFAGKQLVAGDTWDWTISLEAYAPSQYTLKYFFAGPSVLTITATASADGGSFAVVASGADTAALAAGTYAFSMCVFDASNNRTELARGNVEVLGNIATQDAGAEGRSLVKQTLDAIRANIAGSASRVEQEYQLNGRSLRLRSLTELLKLEAVFAYRYQAEQVAAGVLPAQTGQIKASFGGGS